MFTEQAGAELGQAQPQLASVDKRSLFDELFDRFGANTKYNVKAESIHIGSG